MIQLAIQKCCWLENKGAMKNEDVIKLAEQIARTDEEDEKSLVIAGYKAKLLAKWVLTLDEDSVRSFLNHLRGDSPTH